MDFGYGRGYRLQPGADPISLIRGTAVAERSWRMQQEVLGYDQAQKSLAKLRESSSRFEGLALAIKSIVNGVGYSMFPTELASHIAEVVLQLRADPQHFTRVSRGNGREAVACNMKPGAYVLLQAAEALGLWFNYKAVHTGDAIFQAVDVPTESDVTERLHIMLMRLSGNMASTVRDARGQMSQAANTPGVTMVDIGCGESAPADLMIATQLLMDFDLHPKQLAWVLNELKFDMAKGRASAEQHPPSLAAMQQAANAMLVLASDPAAMPQHPNVDLTAAATAAVQGQTSSISAKSMLATPDSGPLPPPGILSDDLLLKLVRGLHVSVLKGWLSDHDVSSRHCIEKEDIVQLVIDTYKSGAEPAPTRPVSTAGPEPFDLSRWRHMALFFKAEAGEAAEGRTPAVTATFKAAVEAAKQNDDELYGCLCAWNAVKAVVDGNSSWRVREMLQLLDYAAACEVKSKSWKGYELLIQPSIKILKQPLRERIQRQIAEARSRRTQHAPSSSSSSTTGSTFSFNDIRSTHVKRLVRPGDEDLLVVPDAGAAAIHTGVQKGEAIKGQNCAGCNNQFHSLLICGGCKCVRYCSQSCQKAHWKAQHKKDCARMKAEKAAGTRT